VKTRTNGGAPNPKICSRASFRVPLAGCNRPRFVGCVWKRNQESAPTFLIPRSGANDVIHRLFEARACDVLVYRVVFGAIQPVLLRPPTVSAFDGPGGSIVTLDPVASLKFGPHEVLHAQRLLPGEGARNSDVSPVLKGADIRFRQDRCSASRKDKAVRLFANDFPHRRPILEPVLLRDDVLGIVQGDPGRQDFP